MAARAQGAVLLVAVAMTVMLSPPARSDDVVRGILVSPPVGAYPVGTTPFSMASADLDADGDLDLATTNINSNTITVLRNNGSAEFTTATYTASQPAALAVANLNGDAWPDLIVVRSTPNCCANTDSLLTLLGTGNAGFGPATQVSGVGFNAGPLAVGDVDGDSVPDAITTNTWFSGDPSELHHEFKIHLGNGDGSWSPQPDVPDPDVAPSTTPLSDVVLLDADGDGDNDLVFGDPGAQRVTVWKNGGTGSFTRSAVIPVGRLTGEIVSDDLDGDGDLDLVVSGSNSGGLIVLLNDGAGAYAPAPWSPIGTGTLWPNSLAGSDVDGDSDLDLVAAGINQDSFSVFLGDGAGAFTAGWGSAYSVPDPRAVVGGDLDGDGYGDVATASNSANLVQIRLSRTDSEHLTTTLDLDAPTPASGWYREPVAATVLGDDVGTGVAAVRCVLDPSAVPASYSALPGCPGSMVISGDGEHHVYRAARDVAGNESAVAHDIVRLDGTSPQVVLETQSPPNDAGWFRDPPTVVPAALDPASGVLSLRCAVDPVTEIGGYDDLSPCADGYTLTQDGSHRVYAVARDLAGNTSTTRFLEVWVDGEAPSVEATVHPVSVVRGNAASVSWVASDRHSGIEDVSCGQPDTSQVGTWFVTCVATDRAGNTSNALAGFTVTPADLSVDLTSAKTAGTRLSVTALLVADGLVDGASVEVSTPSSLRVDAVPAGCSETASGMSCELEAFLGSRALTMLVTPSSPGPHAVEVVVSAPGDPDLANDTDDAGIGPARVCDNAPTSGADIVTGTSAPDILCGLGGSDTLRGLAGDDLIFGGAGLDTVSYAGAPATAVDLRNQGLGLVGARGRYAAGHGRDSFTSIEAALGGSFGDLLIGSDRVDRLRGSLGADVLFGLGSADRLEGGAGDDRLTGGAGLDTLVGGTGTDSCRESSDHRTGCEGP